MNQEQLMQQIDDFLQNHRQDIVDDICDLVRIKSVSVKGADGTPFGMGCKKVFDKAIDISQRLGFYTDNCDYYCASASMEDNDEKQHVGFWNHLDVVPEGDGWTFDPYNPTIYEDYIVGRGTNDNKGAAITSLYCLYFFKKLNYNLKYNYKVIFGANEECGMEDVEYYLKHRPAPSFSIVGDSVFPICYAEKGGLTAQIEIPFVNDDFISIECGTVRNSVSGNAKAVIKKHALNLEDISYENITIVDKGDLVEISALGKGAHAADPENSKDAINILCNFLNKTLIKTNSAFKFIAKLTSTFYGETFDIKHSGTEMGALTCVHGLLNMHDTKLTLSMDIRYPITTDIDDTIQKIKKYCENNGAALVNVKNSKPCFTNPQDEKVVALNKLYNDFMGSNVPPYYTGGGTYSRKIPNALLFGPIIHNRKAKPKKLAHGGAHKTDESACIDEILIGIKIFILTVLKIEEFKF